MGGGGSEVAVPHVAISIEEANVYGSWTQMPRRKNFSDGLVHYMRLPIVLGDFGA